MGDRGTYGPLDRDRHWVLGWGAERTVDYVRDQTVGAALRPVLPVVGDLSRANRGARRWWEASRAIGGRTGAEQPATQVGQDLLHTVADRDRAIAQISTGFRTLASDLAVWLTSNRDQPGASTRAQWLAAEVTPTLEEWSEFVANERKSWWTRFATSWETFEQWWDRLKQLRSVARAHGIALQSAEPVPLPKTIWQQGAEGKGSEATAVLGVLKIGALSALTIMGAAGLFAAFHSLRSRAQGIGDLHGALPQRRHDKKAV